MVEYACGIPQMLKGEFTENVGSNVDSWSIRQPLGVCAGITPFNFPAMVPMWMFPMAIACGNTFVLKPSEKDPSCSMRLAELLKEAGLPDGVFNAPRRARHFIHWVDNVLRPPCRAGAFQAAPSEHYPSARRGRRSAAAEKKLEDLPRSSATLVTARMQRHMTEVSAFCCATHGCGDN